MGGKRSDHRIRHAIQRRCAVLEHRRGSGDLHCAKSNVFGHRHFVQGDEINELAGKRIEAARRRMEIRLRVRQSHRVGKGQSDRAERIQLGDVQAQRTADRDLIKAMRGEGGDLGCGERLDIRGGILNRGDIVRSDDDIAERERLRCRE